MKQFVSVFLIKFWVPDFCCSVTTSCPTHCDPTDHSTPSFPVLHYLPKFAQTHVHWVGDAIQPSNPLLPPSPDLLSSMLCFLPLVFIRFVTTLSVWQSLNLLCFPSPIFFNPQINFFLKFRKYSAIITCFFFLFTNISPVFFRFQLECQRPVAIILCYISYYPMCPWVLSFSFLHLSDNVYYFSNLLFFFNVIFFHSSVETIQGSFILVNVLFSSWQSLLSIHFICICLYLRTLQQ